MDINELKEFLEKSWSRETSAYPDEWSEDNPAWGHCLTGAAIIIQDYFGGEILYAKIKIKSLGLRSHYWNKLNGVEIDLTRKQFPEGVIIPEGKIISREILNQALKILPDFSRRYEILKTKIEAAKRAKREGGR